MINRSSPVRQSKCLVWAHRARVTWCKEESVRNHVSFYYQNRRRLFQVPVVDNVAHLATIFINVLHLCFPTNNFFDCVLYYKKTLKFGWSYCCLLFPIFGAQLLLVILYFSICEAGPVKFYQTPAIYQQVLETTSRNLKDLRMTIMVHRSN